nr:hypothetical protein [Brucella intermedia]
MNVTNLYEPTDRVEAMKGCVQAGYTVVVEGHEIPKLSMLDEGVTIHLILDGRFGINVPRDFAPQVAWLVANALAVGQGYSHLGAKSKDHPFAPEVVNLNEANHAE